MMARKGYSSCVFFVFCCVCISSANARPTGLLDSCHRETPKKYEKAHDFVFRFQKKQLGSNQKRKKL